MDPEAPNHPSFSAGRRWGILFSVALAILALLAIVVMANYLAIRHSTRFTLGSGRHPLAPQTLNLLRSLTNNIEITVFFERDEPDLSRLLTSVLKAYAAASPRLTIDQIAPTSDFAKASLKLKRYHLEAQTLTNHNFITVVCEGSTSARVISDGELGDRDVSDLLAGGHDVPLRNFKGEAAISAAIYAVTNPKMAKAYFLQGHGEHSPEPIGRDASTGYGRFAALLKDQLHVQWEQLSLLEGNDIPADCQLLIVAGPGRPYLESELQKIEAYLKQGGRALVLMNNPSQFNGRSGIEKVLAKWGLQVSDKVVFDPKNAPNGSETDLWTRYLDPEHPVTKPLIRGDSYSMIWLRLPRALERRVDVEGGVDAPRVTGLAWTSEEAIQGIVEKDGVIRRVPYSDPKARMILIAAIEQGDIPGVRTRGTTRIIVVGDSLCLGNPCFEWSPNAYFATLAVNWLLDRPQILLKGLGPRPLEQHKMVLSADQRNQLQWLMLGALPGGVLLLGFLVWLRRRS